MLPCLSLAAVAVPERTSSLAAATCVAERPSGGAHRRSIPLVVLPGNHDIGQARLGHFLMSMVPGHSKFTDPLDSTLGATTGPPDIETETCLTGRSLHPPSLTCTAPDGVQATVKAARCLVGPGMLCHSQGGRSRCFAEATITFPSGLEASIFAPFRASSAPGIASR